jgi:hypothetical protein
MLDNFDISYSGNEKGTTGTLDIKYKDKDGSSSYHDGIKPPSKLGPIDVPPNLINPDKPPFGQPVDPGMRPFEPPVEPGLPPYNQDPGNDGPHGPRGSKYRKHHSGVGPGDLATSPEDPNTDPSNLDNDPSKGGSRPLTPAEN